MSLSGAIAVDQAERVTSDNIRLETGVASVLIDALSVNTAGEFDTSISGQMRNLVVSDQAADVLGPETSFTAEITRDEAGSLTVQSFDLASEFARASGGVALSAEGEIAGDVTAEVSKLAGTDETVSGGLELSASISGQASAPAFEARLSGKQLKLQGRDLSDLVLEAAGVADPAAPQADVTLTGALEGRPVNGSVVVTQADGVVRVDPLRLQVADNLISGKLVLDEAYRPKGKIDLDLKDIGSLSALALQSIEGSGGGTITFDVRDTQSVADIQFGVPKLSGDGFDVRDARLTGRVEDLLGTPKPTGSLDVAEVSAAGTDISGLAASFSQADGWTVIDGKAQAAGMPVALKARVRPGDDATELEIEAARTAWKGLAVSLSELSPHCGS